MHNTYLLTFITQGTILRVIWGFVAILSHDGVLRQFCLFGACPTHSRNALFKTTKDGIKLFLMRWSLSPF